MTPDNSSKDPVSNPEIEAAITGALERRPDIAIPEGFAAMVAASAAAQSSARRAYPQLRASRTSVAEAIGYAAIVAMAIVLMVLTRLHPEALHTGHGILFGVEVLLLLQLMAVGLWLGRPRFSS